MFNNVAWRSDESPIRTVLSCRRKDRPGITVQVYNGEYQNPPFEQINRLIEVRPLRHRSGEDFLSRAGGRRPTRSTFHYLGKLAITLN